VECRFDIGSNWKPPHKEHRDGYNVDIQMTTVPQNHRARLKQIMTEYGAKILEEDTHYHLDFSTSVMEGKLEC
jgi:hypothetical protein